MDYLKGLKTVLSETSTVGSGVLGTADTIGNQGGAVGNNDFYATGDARMPTSLFGTKKKKKKKNNSKKDKKGDYGVPVVFRRAFVEESIDTEILIDGVITCAAIEHRNLVEKIADRHNVLMYAEDDQVFLNGTDKEIRSVIDTLYETIGEHNFCNRYYCLLGEFNYQDSLKEPKKRPEDYNQSQLRKGMKIEMEHTTNKQLARTIAMHHMDEDEFYYDHLKAMEDKYNEQPKQRQRQAVRTSGVKTPV